MATKKTTAQIEFKAVTSQFDDGIKSMNQSIKTNTIELKLNSTQLKGNADDFDLLSKRQSILQDELSSSSEKVNLIEQSLKKAKEMLGENSKEYYNLSNALLNAKNQEQAIKNEIDATSKKLANQKGDTNNLEKATDTLGDSFNDTEKDAKRVGDIIEGSLKADAIKGLATAAKDLATEFAGIASETREYRTDMAKLEMNTTAAGYSFDTYKGKMNNLVAITGEADSSIEALSNLMAIGFNDEQMSVAIDNLSGAVIKFPDTLKIESLADSLQETIATSSATGQFSELLGRMGINVEDFNKKLEGATTTQERQNIALQTLSSTGLSQVNEAYQENNKNLIEGAESQERANQAMADLGEKMEPVAIALNGAMATGLGLLTDALGFIGEHQTVFTALALGIGAAAVAFGGISLAMGIYNGVLNIMAISSGAAAASTTILGTAFTFLTSPIGILVLAIGGIVAVGYLLVQNWQSISTFAQETWNTVCTGVGEFAENIKVFFNGIMTFVSENWQAILGWIINPFGSAFAWLYENCEGVRTFVDGFVGFVVDIFSFKGLQEGVSAVFNNCIDAIMTPINTVKGLISAAIDAIKGFFNFNISWPKIKLPHFSIKGSFNPIDWLSEGIPKISVDWYAKGGLFTKPTIFANGFGEAGHEYAIPLNERSVNPLAKMIVQQMESQNSMMDSFMRILENAVFEINLNAEIDGTPLASKISKSQAIRLKRGYAR